MTRLLLVHLAVWLQLALYWRVSSRLRHVLSPTTEAK